MSFSKDVKEELSLQYGEARHCSLAELAAILSFGGVIGRRGKGYCLKLQTESLLVARKYFTLIRKTFNICIDISVRSSSHGQGNRIYTLILTDPAMLVRVLQAAKLPHENLSEGEIGKASQLLVQNTCCKRAFIRGAFLISGSMSNPKKSYHLEIVVNDSEKAEQLKCMIQSFSIDAKIVTRKKNFVVYIKEGSQIVDLLNVMEAHVALMNLENVRILKDMRNQVNRQVNCEAANINKTVVAASKQIEDIIYIRDHIGFGDLAEGLEEIATLRIQYPEASLKELGAMLTPPIGKSGVNHRLRKLSMIAEGIREHKEENSYDS
jgi:hypothetical protein